MVRILLAEDDATMRAYIARSLERAGYGVAAVDSGIGALALLDHGSFDLLLTDIVMPMLDGIELAQRASAMYPAMRVMFITGFAAVTLGNGALPADAKMLSKPFHLRDLTSEIDRLFQIGAASGI